MKIIVAIPAYNEATRIEHVVRNALPCATEVVVIDDASTDDTSACAVRAGARVLRHCVNRDLGGALQTAFAYARKSNADVLVTIDGDGQFLAHEIERLLQPIARGTADVVVGSRFLQRNTVPFVRRWGNRVGNVVTWLLFGAKVTDSQSGFRAFTRKAFNSIEVRTSGMEVSSEIVKEIHVQHLRLIEVPVTVRYDRYSLSKGQGIARGVRTFFALLLHRITR